VKAILMEEKSTIIIMKMAQPIKTKINLNTMREMSMKRVKMASHSTRITMKMMEMVVSQ
jgi:hypothetical protein